MRGKFSHLDLTRTGVTQGVMNIDSMAKIFSTMGTIVMEAKIIHLGNVPKYLNSTYIFFTFSAAM